MSERHAIAQLTAARMREAIREPGVLFWVFGFPILLSVARGALHRLSRPGADRHEPDVRVDVGDRLGDREHARPQAAQAPAGHAGAPPRSVAGPGDWPRVLAAARGWQYPGLRVAGIRRAC